MRFNFRSVARFVLLLVFVFQLEVVQAIKFRLLNKTDDGPLKLGSRLLKKDSIPKNQNIKTNFRSSKHPKGSDISEKVKKNLANNNTKSIKERIASNTPKSVNETKVTINTKIVNENKSNNEAKIVKEKLAINEAKVVKERKPSNSMESVDESIESTEEPVKFLKNRFSGVSKFTTLPPNWNKKNDRPQNEIPDIPNLSFLSNIKPQKNTFRVDIVSLLQKNFKFSKRLVIAVVDPNTNNNQVKLPPTSIEENLANFHCLKEILGRVSIYEYHITIKEKPRLIKVVNSQKAEDRETFENCRGFMIDDDDFGVVSRDDEVTDESPDQETNFLGYED